MASFTVTISREVDDQEIDDMIFGTGALGHAWWGPCQRTEDGWKIGHWDRDEGPDFIVTELTADTICDAFTECLQNEYVDPEMDDTKQAIDESLGYLDSQFADVVLQWAVFGEIVYG